MSLKISLDTIIDPEIENEMTPNSIVIYAEDPEFYRYYVTPNSMVSMEKLDCVKVRELVKRGSSGVLGIVDGDFDDSFEHEHLFKIDYYSIENVVLIYHKGVHKLKEEALIYLEDSLDKKYRISHTRDGDNITIKKSSRIDSSFDNYVRRKIIDKDSYIRYMDLKHFVNSFSSQNYQKTLPTQVKFEELFSKDSVERFLEVFTKFCGNDDDIVMDYPQIFSFSLKHK